MVCVVRLAARQRLVDAVHEQGAVGEAGQHIVEREVRHRVRDPRVGQGDDCVDRERHQHLLLGEAVGASPAVSRDGECADDAAVLLDRRGHRRFEPLPGEDWSRSPSCG